MAFASKTSPSTAQEGRNACCWSMTTSYSSSICAKSCSRPTQACRSNVLLMDFRQASSPKRFVHSSSCSTSTCRDLTASTYADACARTEQQQPPDSWFCRAQCQASTSSRPEPQARMPGSRKALPRRKFSGSCNYPRARCALELKAFNGHFSWYHNLAMCERSTHIVILDR